MDLLAPGPRPMLYPWRDTFHDSRFTAVAGKAGGHCEQPASPDYSWMPSRGVRDGSPPRLLTREADAGVLAVRRGGRTRTASPGERIRRRSGYSWI